MRSNKLWHLLSVELWDLILPFLPSKRTLAALVVCFPQVILRTEGYAALKSLWTLDGKMAYPPDHCLRWLLAHNNMTFQTLMRYLGNACRNLDVQTVTLLYEAGAPSRAQMQSMFACFYNNYVKNQPYDDIYDRAPFHQTLVFFMDIGVASRKKLLDLYLQACHFNDLQTVSLMTARFTPNPFASMVMPYKEDFGRVRQIEATMGKVLARGQTCVLDWIVAKEGDMFYLRAFRVKVLCIAHHSMVIKSAKHHMQEVLEWCKPDEVLITEVLTQVTCGSTFIGNALFCACLVDHFDGMPLPLVVRYSVIPLLFHRGWYAQCQRLLELWHDQLSPDDVKSYYWHSVDSAKYAAFITERYPHLVPTTA